MSGRQPKTRILLLIMSMVAGGFASMALSGRLIEGGFSIISFLLGAVFSALGWIMQESIVEAIVLLVITAVLAGIAFINLKSEMLRILVIALFCGFNIGKLVAGVHGELEG